MTIQTHSEKTKVMTKVILSSDNMKDLKNMVKKHRVNKHVEILENLKIDVLDSYKIKAIYSNLYITIEKTIDTLHNDLSNETSFLIPIDLIKKLTGIKKNSVYSFEISEDKIIFNNNGITQSFTNADAEEFPKLPEHDNLITAGTIDHHDLMNIKKANLSTSNSETRSILTNVTIRNNEMISTDSHRLFKTKISNVNADFDILLQRNLIEFLIANETQKDFQATIAADNKHIVIETYNTKYIHNWMSGNYPEVDRLIPTDFNNVFTVYDMTHLKQTIEAITKLAKGTIAHLEIIDNQTLSIHAKNDAGEEVKITIDIQSDYVKTGFKISVSSKYMLDAIKQIDTKDGLQFNIVNHLSPFTIHEVNNDKTVALVLPVRIIK